MTSKTLWEILSEHGKKVVVMNVPLTYPPRPVNGILVSGFLATSLKKATYPPEISSQLEQLSYRIDADASVAHESLDAFLEDLHHTLGKRIQAMYHFLDYQPWDYFHVHIMGTDRINHFMWGYMEEGHPQYFQAFMSYYNRIDEILGELENKLNDEVTFIVMSDHGFCSIKREVNLSRYFMERGWLKLRNGSPQGLQDIHLDAKAYTLIPGRIFVNLKGREPRGGVDPSQYERVRDMLSAGLRDLELPETGEKVIKKVFRREEIYSGDQLNLAADLIAIPFNGYDLKANIKNTNLSERTALSGMHTYDDSSLYIRNIPSIPQDVEIVDLLPTILSLMDVPIPEDVDGSVII